MNSDYDFAVVFETSGAVNKEGENVLRQIIRFASKREGVTHTVYAARAWARLSCCVQFAAAQQILNRDFVDSRLNSLLLNCFHDFCCIDCPYRLNKDLESFFNVFKFLFT